MASYGKSQVRGKYQTTINQMGRDLMSCYWKQHRGCGGHDYMVVTTTCAISAYHLWSCKFEPRSWRGVLDTTFSDEICQLLVTVR
jgi:hypothetical protein